VSLDYGREMALVAVSRQDEGEEIVAVARYAVDPSTGAAEVAFVVRDDWQQRGLGTHLFSELIRIGRIRGLDTFEARVLAGNEGMIRLFHKCALGPVESHLDRGEFHLTFTAQPAAARTGMRPGY
jgi:RimJ/RimL family protein N-acetyltransferase